MDLTLLSMLVLVGTCLFASIVSGMIGLGGGIMLFSIIATLVPTIYVVPLHSSIQLISNGTRVFLFRKHIRWVVVFLFLSGLLPGALIGIYIFSLLPRDLIKLSMGIFILMVTFMPKTKVKSGESFSIFFPVGLFSGIIGIFVGAIGPFIAPFFFKKNIIKEELIATKATCQLLSHALKIPLFGFIGANILVYWNILIYFAIAVVVGTFIGKQLVGKMSEKTFNRIFKIIIALIAFRIIVLQIVKLTC